MKKPPKSGKTTKAKTPAKKPKREPNPILEMFKNMDPEIVAMLREVVLSETALDAKSFGPEDPVDRFAEYLQDCANGDLEDGAEKDATLNELVGELSDIQMDYNGGDPKAREKMRAIYDLLDQAIETHSLQPVDLMLTAKIFADAGWDVPDRLRKSVGEALGGDSPKGIQGGEADMVGTLMGMLDQLDQNPFDAYGYLQSMMAGFPQEAVAAVLHGLSAAEKPVIHQILAGFLLHREAALAEAAAEALAACAKRAPVESLLIERLVLMRPWLEPSRQTSLDATIKALRLNASPPVKAATLPKIMKGYLSVSDGSGARSLVVTQRVRARSRLASAMMKHTGVVDAMILPNLSKKELEEVIGEMKSATPFFETGLTSVVRMLRLALSDNCASKNPPPFKLVELVESLGLGPVHPDPATPAEICAELLADLPPEQTDAAALAAAYAATMASNFEFQWFEAGEELDDLLRSVKGTKQRIAKVMKDYLPTRRQFWARQCAFSALALHEGNKVDACGRTELALIGRDIASDAPLDKSPLMMQIAKVSVGVFEGRA